MSGILAIGESSTYTAKDNFAGDGDVRTTTGTFATTQTIVALTPIARIAATNLIVPWAPGASDGSQFAIGLTSEAVDTTAGAASHGYYISGDFNTAKINWTTSGATTAQKAVAFDRTMITVRTIGG